ncbi:MAG: hypothetical protein HY040_02750 [Planctomycetes bacterium]|nr:hypothetical protein [Planctomycetota bacterium]
MELPGVEDLAVFRVQHLIKTRMQDDERRLDGLRLTNRSIANITTATAPIWFIFTVTRRVMKPWSFAEPSTSVPMGTTSAV